MSLTCKAPGSTTKVFKQNLPQKVLFRHEKSRVFSSLFVLTACMLIVQTRYIDYFSLNKVLLTSRLIWLDD